MSTYTYDAAMRLTSVTDGASTSTFVYNGDGDRVSQTVDGTLTTYILDTATPLTMVLAETTGEASIFYLHGLDLVAQSDGANVEYFAYDGLGSVRQVVDDAAHVLLAQTYDPYGGVYASVGAGETSFGFTGEYTDESGLVYLRARYYQPGMGRFLNMDPSRAEMNPYQYAASNPIYYVDPFGLCAQGDAACLAEVENLETIYGFLMYWPGRSGVLSRLQNLTHRSFEDCPENLAGSSLFGDIISLQQWTTEEVRSIRSALLNIATMIGIPSTRNLTDRGIIYRTNFFTGGHSTAPGMVCQSGNCSGAPAFSIFGGATYSIGFSNSWDQDVNETNVGAEFNIDTYVREYWFIHEFGHLLGYRHVDLARQLYRRYCRRHDEAPSTYAATNESEFFAETFALYVWERAYQAEWENLDEAVATVLESDEWHERGGFSLQEISEINQLAVSVRSGAEWLYFNTGARPLGQVEFTNNIGGNTFNLEEEFRREVIRPLLYNLGD